MELEQYRAEFPITQTAAFLNHASVSTYHRRVSAALHEHIAAMQTTPFDHLWPRYEQLGVNCRQAIARLINARHGHEIVPVPDTATGINIAANSLPLRAGDNVLILDGDYPANVYPWLNLASKGVLAKWVPQHGGGLDLEQLAARIDRRTRVIALSSAMYATGFRNDLAAVGALCRERDIFFVVDAIQTLGAFPLDVQACGIDMLACGGQKWLLGVPGSGFLYCRAELVEQLELGAYVGAASVVDWLNFGDYNFTLQPTPQRFVLGSVNFLGLAALHATVGLLLEVGIERIAARILELTSLLIDDLQAHGYAIRSNLKPAHRSGIVIVDHDDPVAASHRLLAANVITQARGAGLRVAPHFYNNAADVLRVGEVLGRR